MRREVKLELHRRRAFVRDHLRAQRAALKARRRPRRRWRWLLLPLLLLLLLRECSCDEPAAPEVPEPPPPPPKPARVTPDSPPPPAPRRPAQGRLRKRRRPALEPPAATRHPWLDDFRLQVAARSVRLAPCFDGAERPGAVRWTCALDPEAGTVSDQRFEPIGPISIGAAQRRCLEAALSDPIYKLAHEDGGTTPDRVSLVLEF